MDDSDQEEEEDDLMDDFRKGFDLCGAQASGRLSGSLMRIWKNTMVLKFRIPSTTRSSCLPIQHNARTENLGWSLELEHFSLDNLLTEVEYVLFSGDFQFELYWTNKSGREFPFSGSAGFHDALAGQVTNLRKSNGYRFSFCARSVEMVQPQKRTPSPETQSTDEMPKAAPTNTASTSNTITIQENEPELFIPGAIPAKDAPSNKAHLNATPPISKLPEWAAHLKDEDQKKRSKTDTSSPTSNTLGLLLKMTIGRRRWLPLAPSMSRERLISLDTMIVRHRSYGAQMKSKILL